MRISKGVGWRGVQPEWCMMVLLAALQAVGVRANDANSTGTIEAFGPIANWHVLDARIRRTGGVCNHDGFFTETTKPKAAPVSNCMLPYTRWLDYCTVSFLVPDVTARTNFLAVYRQLAALTEADVAPKREML